MFVTRLFTPVLLATCAAAQGHVWVVDFMGGPGSDFTDLSLAIQSAADGDSLLVRSGGYSVWDTIDGRSLTIAGDGPFVQLSGRLVVQNLAANQRFSLRGVVFQYPGEVELLDNDGVAWIEDCLIWADLFGGSGPYGAVQAVNSRLVLQNTSLTGSMQYGFHGAPPTAGLFLEQSVAVVHGGGILGGEGVDTIFPDLPGAAGAELVGSTLYASGTAITGGFGASKPGGTAIVASAGSTVHLLDVAVSGGAGVPPGDKDSVDGSSSITVGDGSAHALTSTPAPRVGQPLQVSAEGAPGDGVLLLVSTKPLIAPLGPDQAVLLVNPAPPFLSTVLGTIPAGGTLAGTFTVPALGGPEGIELFVQDVYLDAALAEVRFGPGTAPLLLDAAF
jgi:hypothetical protein